MTTFNDWFFIPAAQAAPGKARRGDECFDREEAKRYAGDIATDSARRFWSGITGILAAVVCAFFTYLAATGAIT
jgi:hypothetical protein